MKTLADIGQYLLDHYEVYRDWDEEIFERWLNWHALQGFLCVCLDCQDDIAGAVIIRPVMKPEDADEHFAFDPEGSCLFIEVAVATRPGVLRMLTLMGLERFGERQTVAWKRAPFYETKVHDLKRVMRVILRKKEYIYGNN